MRRKSQFIPVLAIVLIAFAGCSSDDNPLGTDSIKGSGTLETELRTLSAVHTLDIRMPAEIRLRISESQSVSVTVDDNILEFIVTRDSSGTLIVEVDPTVTITNYDLTVELTLIDLRAIVSRAPVVVSSTAKIDVDDIALTLSSPATVALDLDVNTLNMVVSGVGTITLTGKANRHELVVSGTGLIGAFDFFTDETDIVLSGTGTINVTAASTLDVVISGTGDVSYKGTPVINSTISGSGNLIDAN